MTAVWEKSLDLLQVHCEGEIGKVIVGGAPDIPGATALDKMSYINEVDDSLRRFVTFEPRAHVAMSVNLVIEPTRQDADAGFIVLQADRAHPMSGSNCICVVTALLESGRIPMTEPETVVRLDTPAGLIVARATCRNGECVSVTLDNVPSFVLLLDAPLETPAWGKIKADVAFGGVFYAIVDASEIGIDIVPENARLLAEAGTELKRLLADQVKVSHPKLRGVDQIAYVMFRDIEGEGLVRTCTTLEPGRVDRSPCGTGSSANLATLVARGRAKVGDRWISRSIIGGEFLGEVAGLTEVAGRTAVLPRITGRGWVYGREQLRMTAADPFPKGFSLSDTWGEGASRM